MCTSTHSSPQAPIGKSLLVVAAFLALQSWRVGLLGVPPHLWTRSLSLESCLRTSPGCWAPNNEVMGGVFFFLLPSNSQALRCSNRPRPTDTVSPCSKPLGGFEEGPTLSRACCWPYQRHAKDGFPFCGAVKVKELTRPIPCPQNQQILVFQSKKKSRTMFLKD